MVKTSSNAEKKSWWETFGGVCAGIGALLAGIAAIVAIIPDVPCIGCEFKPNQCILRDGTPGKVRITLGQDDNTKWADVREFVASDYFEPGQPLLARQSTADLQRNEKFAQLHAKAYWECCPLSSEEPRSIC